MPDASHETSIHANLLAPHVKEIDRARAYQALSVLVGSDMSVREAAASVVAAWTVKDRPGYDAPPVVKAMEMLSQASSLGDALGRATLPPEELAVVLRVDELIAVNPSDTRIVALLGAAAAMLQFDLTVRRGPDTGA